MDLFSATTALILALAALPLCPTYTPVYVRSVRSNLFKHSKTKSLKSTQIHSCNIAPCPPAHSHLSLCHPSVRLGLVQFRFGSVSFVSSRPFSAFAAPVYHPIPTPPHLTSHHLTLHLPIKIEHIKIRCYIPPPPLCSPPLPILLF